MKPNNLILKCYAQSHDDIWEAFCLDFDLAVQGESFEEVAEKLKCQIVEYVHDALVGEDKQYASQLLNRRAPLSQYIKYYYILARIHFNQAHQGLRRKIDQPVPLTPVEHC